MRKAIFLSIAVMLGASACAGRQRVMTGTKIPDTQLNRQLVGAIKDYRDAVERRDAEALLNMASKSYWEDSGTPTVSDDYGYDGLAAVLAERLGRVSDIRYSMRFVSAHSDCAANDLHDGCRARVEALVDASFSLQDATGKMRRPDKRDQAEFVLERKGDRWLFVSGM